MNVRGSKILTNCAKLTKLKLLNISTNNLENHKQLGLALTAKHIKVAQKFLKDDYQQPFVYKVSP